MQRVINVPNFIKIGQSVANILRFFALSRWWLPPSCIVEFAKFYWLTVSGGPRRIAVPNFDKISQLVAKILIFRFFKMAADRHLLFVWGIFGPPMVSISGSLSLCKIWLWSKQCFYNMGNSIFLHVAEQWSYLILMLQLGGGYFIPQTHFLSCCSETAWNCDKSFCDFSWIYVG